MQPIGCRELGISVLLTLVSTVAQAQITTDGTLGRAGTLQGPNYHIPAELGQQRGGNLFHSFGQFSINTGESAIFSGPNSVSNIIGRVTGGNVSFIDGTLRSTIPGANLYLLNPAGVLFGEHAQLDVPGSVHVSTADYLRLSDGGRFDARMPANSVLTVAPVEAFGFLGGTPGRITVEGAFLKVPEGQILSLIGGDITLTNATLYAPAGRIKVAAVASAGEVIPTDTDLTLQGFDALGTFTIERTTAERPTVNLGSPFGEVTLADLDTSGAGGGAIFIRGGQWFSRGGWVFADTYGNRPGGGVNVAINSEMRFENESLLMADTFGTGNAGAIRLDVGRLNLSDSSAITSRTGGSGQGGDITIKARETVMMTSGSGLFANALKGSTGNAGSIQLTGPSVELDESVIQSDTEGIGNAGAVELNVDRLSLFGGSQISSSTFSVGRGGDLNITASEVVTIAGMDAEGYPSGLFTTAESDFTGNAGNINLTTTRLILTGGSEISSGTWGTGHGGNLNITASEAVTIDGYGTDANGNLYTSDLATTANPGSTGNAGNINLNTANLTLTGGGRIVAMTWGKGHGGDLSITAHEAITIASDTENVPSGLAVSTTSTGDAGSISIIAPTVTIRGGGRIQSNTEGSGKAGGVVMDVGRLNLIRGGQISASTWGTGQGGNLTITVSEATTIAGTDAQDNPSGLFANAYATGNAGDITLTTPSLTLSNGGGILARSISTTGGNILINADHLKLLDGSEISSSVAGDEFSDGGNVTINSINMVALNGSSITAKANQGKGGNILVNAEVFLHDAASVDEVLNASSQVAGNDGTVQNNAPTTDISGSLTALPARYLNAADQLSHRCGMGDRDARSSFTVQGRGALPLGPDEPAAVQVTGCRSEQPSPAHATPPTSVITATSATTMLSFGDR